MTQRNKKAGVQNNASEKNAFVQNNAALILRGGAQGDISCCWCSKSSSCCWCSSRSSTNPNNKNILCFLVGYRLAGWELFLVYWFRIFCFFGFLVLNSFCDKTTTPPLWSLGPINTLRDLAGEISREQKELRPMQSAKLPSISGYVLEDQKPSLKKSLPFKKSRQDSISTSCPGPDCDIYIYIYIYSLAPLARSLSSGPSRKPYPNSLAPLARSLS